MCRAELTLIILMVDEKSEGQKWEGKIYLRLIPRFKGAASGLCSCFEVSVL